MDELFRCYRTEFETCSPAGETRMLTVETDMRVICQDLVDRVADGTESEEDAAEWLAEWGPRRHEAEVEIADMLGRGDITGDDLPEDDGEFETYVEALERVIEGRMETAS